MEINRPNGCLFLSSTETMDCGFTCKPTLAVVECCLYRIKVRVRTRTDLLCDTRVLLRTKTFGLKE